MPHILTLLCVFILSVNLISYGQDGSDPAVTNWNLTPSVLTGIGSTFRLQFRIGNNGAYLISGVGKNDINRMQFSICLSKCAPKPTDPSNVMTAVSGPLLNYFDVTYNSLLNCLEGIQKENVAIPETSVYNVYIEAVVTQLSTSSSIYDVGASCNIAPHKASGLRLQPTDNDIAQIYTRTTALAMPISLVSFTAQAQQNRMVVLNWQTSWERNNVGYIIERSKDLTNFEVVGQVDDVMGSSNSLTSYRLVDDCPYRGTSYYRLRQVDADGTSQTYPAESVILEGRYGVHPNPVVSRTFTLELDEPTHAVLHLYNTSGNEIGLNQSPWTDTSTQLSPSVKLDSGVYILSVEERGTTRRHRIVVQ